MERKRKAQALRFLFFGYFITIGKEHKHEGHKGGRKALHRKAFSFVALVSIRISDRGLPVRLSQADWKSA
ncbi:MAG: hypothetical protein ACOYZ6_13870, partial [Chloroflexota bacterium]